MRVRFALFCTFLLTAGFSLWPQAASSPAGLYDEPVSLVGIKLDELIQRFGTPQSVYAARGDEYWQDDVVFVYPEGDFYIYRDRVWQIGLQSMYGIKVGDAKAVAMLVLGASAQDNGDHILYSFPSGAWPLSLCVNLIDDKIAAIFIYRSDY
jgi:hypothetical protein